MAAAEFVSVAGKRISGSAIPVKIPKTLRESLEVSPDICSLAGIRITSILPRRVSSILFMVRGTEIWSNFLRTESGLLIFRIL